MSMSVFCGTILSVPASVGQFVQSRTGIVPQNVRGRTTTDYHQTRNSYVIRYVKTTCKQSFVVKLHCKSALV